MSLFHLLTKAVMVNEEMPASAERTKCLLPSWEEKGRMALTLNLR